jgi:hypothetical protein
MSRSHNCICVTLSPTKCFGTFCPIDACYSQNVEPCVNVSILRGASRALVAIRFSCEESAYCHLALNVADVPTQGIANVLLSCATLKLLPSSELVKALSAQAFKTVKLFNHQDVASTMLAFALLEQHPGPALFQALCIQGVQVTRDANPQSLSNMLYACAALREVPSTEFFQRLCARGVGAASMYNAQVRESAELVFMFAFMYANISVFVINASTWCVCMYSCVFMYVCMYVYLHICIYARVCVNTYVYVCMYIWMDAFLDAIAKVIHDIDPCLCNVIHDIDPCLCKVFLSY